MTLSQHCLAKQAGFEDFSLKMIFYFFIMLSSSSHLCFPMIGVICIWSTAAATVASSFTLPFFIAPLVIADDCLINWRPRRLFDLVTDLGVCIRKFPLFLIFDLFSQI